MQELNKLTKGQPDYHIPLNENAAEIDRRQGISAPAIHIINRLYEGKDLNVLYNRDADLAQFPTVFDFLDAKSQAGDFEGLNVGDFIPVLSSDGILYEMEIAGINTYKGYGDGANEVGNHIDFIARDCHPDPFVMNRVNFNNGTTVDSSPWLASELEARLNNRQKNVVSVAAATPTLVSADYRNTGILNTLPAPLRAVIKTKRALLLRRFTAGSLLLDDNSWDWKDLSPLWIPFEMEVVGTNARATEMWEQSAFVQYPIFANNMKRVKHAGKDGVRSLWWLGSAGRGGSAHFVIVGSSGDVNDTGASVATVRVAFGFRI